jgi:hypothetical protein
MLCDEGWGVGGGGLAVRNKYAQLIPLPPLMGQKSITGPLEGVGSENNNFLGPELAIFFGQKGQIRKILSPF